MFIFYLSRFALVPNDPDSICPVCFITKENGNKLICSDLVTKDPWIYYYISGQWGQWINIDWVKGIFKWANGSYHNSKPVKVGKPSQTLQSDPST